MFLSHLEAKSATTKSGSTLDTLAAGQTPLSPLCYCPPAASQSHVVVWQANKQNHHPSLPHTQQNPTSITVTMGASRMN